MKNTKDMKNMKIEDIKYLFTLIGGICCIIHELFVITKDDEIYYSNKFKSDDLFDVKALFDDNGLLNCEMYFISDLYPNKLKRLFYKVDFETFKKEDCFCSDGIYVELYKNDNGKLKCLVNQHYEGNNMPAVAYVIRIFNNYEKKHRRFQL